MQWIPWYQECTFLTALYYASIFRASTPLLSSSIICQGLGVIAIRVKQRLMLSWCDPWQQWVCPRVACIHLVVTPIGIHDFNAYKVTTQWQVTSWYALYHSGYVGISLHIHVYTHGKPMARVKDRKTSCPVWRHKLIPHAGITNLLQLLPSNQPTGSTWFPVLTIHIFTMQSAQGANMHMKRPAAQLVQQQCTAKQMAYIGEKGVRIFWNGTL